MQSHKGEKLVSIDASPSTSEICRLPPFFTFKIELWIWAGKGHSAFSQSGQAQKELAE